MKNLKLIAVGVGSMAATAAFILSCGSGPKNASAQTCASWEITLFSIFPDQTTCATGFPTLPDTCKIPSGWEVVGAQNGDTILLRRCAP